MNLSQEILGTVIPLRQKNREKKYAIGDDSVDERKLEKFVHDVLGFVSKVEQKKSAYNKGTFRRDTVEC